MDPSAPFGLWPRLIEPDYHALVEAAAREVDALDAAAISRLRRHWPADLVRLALQLALARRKAAGKFDHPDRLIADPVGVEQATSLDVARHKAQRFAALGVDRVCDLCCGIGGDAMALASVARVTLVDLAAERVWMARHNVQQAAGYRAAALVADAACLTRMAAPYHIDPARRTAAGRRVYRLADYTPGPEALHALVARARDGAIKTGPGVDFTALPPGEIEVINRSGTLVQAVVWTGRLARGRGLRTATRLPSGDTLTGRPSRPVALSPPARYLLAVDPAVERAGLVGVLCEQLNLAAVHPALGLLTAEERIDSPWLTPYRLIEAMPWRQRRVAEWLKAHDAGEVVVKTRDRAVDPDTVAPRLRGHGSQPFTVFVLRVGRKVVAWITRRE